MNDKTHIKCSGLTEVYSRVTGFYRPVQAWNAGKTAEFFERRTYTPQLNPQPTPPPKPEDTP